MPVPEQVELPFPFKGVSGDSAYIRTPEGTSPDALNVVGFDAVGSRLRGGQRPGLSKFWTTQLGGGERVQALIAGTSAVQPTAGGYSEDFTQSDGILATTNWALFEMLAWPDFTASTTQPYVSSNAIVFDDTTGSGLDRRVGAVHETAQSETSYTLTQTMTLVKATSGNIGVGGGFILQAASASPTLTVDTNCRLVYFYMSSSNYILHIGGSSQIGGLGTAGDWKDPSYWATPREFKVVVNGNDAEVFIDNVSARAYTMPSSLAANTYVGFFVQKRDTAANSATVDDWSLSGLASVEGSHNNHVVAVAAGNVYQADAGGEPSVATDGTGALDTAIRKIAATLNHGSPNDTGDLPGHQMVYFADGTTYKRLDLNDATVLDWAAASGTLPVDADGNIATIAATYRNRVVLSGVIGDPQNWHMSAVNDPTDYAYFPTTTSATMAVAGNNSDAGLVGDIITCLAPYSDDIMLMGGDHTLWVMRGDPAARGMIDNLSYQTGIVGPQAFAWDEKGIVHFFGAGTHWRMAASAAAPEPVSRGRMDREWSALDLSANEVILVWDVLRHGLHIHVTPHTTGTAKHWFWDERTDAYWPIEYPNTMNPTAILAHDAALLDDTATLLGGADGYVRQVDPTAKDDDGTLIDSYVFFRPLHLGGITTNTKLLQSLVVLGEDSDSATLSVYSGETAQAALDLGKLHFARTVSAGRNKLLNKAMGNTLLIRLGDDTITQTWACEQIDVTLTMGGKTRTGSL